MVRIDGREPGVEVRIQTGQSDGALLSAIVSVVVDWSAKLVPFTLFAVLPWHPQPLPPNLLASWSMLMIQK